ncbi:hypothetical protein GQ53DRAFT_757641 [Thozetella sp. PMI_491]|nr:hypothetical protein GQ53DRAFT_757641 [Thozetella sp. PMI_491]
MKFTLAPIALMLAASVAAKPLDVQNDGVVNPLDIRSDLSADIGDDALEKRFLGSIFKPNEKRPPSELEKADWLKCLRKMWLDFENGRNGDKTTCTMLTCMQRVAKENDRGGVLTTLSTISQAFCLLPNLNPFEN